VWPTSAVVDPVAEDEVSDRLAQIGYDITDTRAATVAFQRRFAPHRLDGVPDLETRQVLARVMAAVEAAAAKEN
jgi:N-acetyl-anhydromuramyl-L-alanine amidase AmpD